MSHFAKTAKIILTTNLKNVRQICPDTSIFKYSIESGETHISSHKTEKQAKEVLAKLIKMDAFS